jgi:DNA polymerase-3 subunit delta
MIILLHGPDTFRSSQKLKEIIENYQAKHKDGLNFRQIDWSGESLAELKQLLSLSSMFGGKKLVVVKNAGAAKKDEQQNLLALLKEKAGKAEENILVFIEAGETKEEELFSWLKKKAEMSENFESLSGAKLKNWIQKEAARCGGKIGVSGIEALVGFVGSDLWQMSQEINKLASFKKDEAILEEDVNLLVKSKFDPNIFATIDALANRNKALAYKLLHQHLERGENEIYILTMFVYQFRNLLQIKSLIDGGVSSDGLAKKTGLHPFVIKKSWGLVRNFSLEVLKKIYERLMKLDVAIKRGKIEPETALDLIVAEIAG